MTLITIELQEVLNETSGYSEFKKAWIDSVLSNGKYRSDENLIQYFCDNGIMFSVAEYLVMIERPKYEDSNYSFFQ